jgi:hypothetical protein
MRGHEDFNLWLRLATQGSFIYSPETLVSYRRHGQQATGKKHYEMRMSRAKLNAVIAVRDQINSTQDNDLKRIFSWVLTESHISAAWAMRQTGNYAEARRIAMATLKLQPTSARAWYALVASLKPRWKKAKS